MADTPHNEEESSKEINHARSCSLRSAGRALRGARRADHGHDTHRHSGTARRQDRRLDGTGKLRTVPQVRLLRPRLLRKREPLETPSEVLRVTLTSDRFHEMSNRETRRT